jgi:LmbE family N-acetylglucosaminyl deacetylase
MTRTFAMLVLAVTFCVAVSAQDPLPPFRPLLPTDSILVVAPHPDDESLCCAGIMYAAREVGARVSVVWVTLGDGFRWSAMVGERRLVPRQQGFRELAARREAEARAAARILGLDPQSLYFLGYPDRGVLALLLDHYYPHTPWRSKFTGAHAVDYADAVNPGAEYDGENLERDFLRVLQLVQPTLVLAPSPQDTHPDHRGTGILAWRAMNALDESDRIRFWIVHGGRGWPEPHAYRPELPQKIAPRGLGMKWEQFALDADMRAAKLRAIRAHRSQTAVMGRVMEGYVRSDELFSRTAIPPRSVCTLPQPCESGERATAEEPAL